MDIDFWEYTSRSPITIEEKYANAFQSNDIMPPLITNENQEPITTRSKTPIGMFNHGFKTGKT
jgi:hypothetical protein